MNKFKNLFKKIKMYKKAYLNHSEYVFDLQKYDIKDAKIEQVYEPHNASSDVLGYVKRVRVISSKGE